MSMVPPYEPAPAPPIVPAAPIGPVGRVDDPAENGDTAPEVTGPGEEGTT